MKEMVNKMVNGTKKIVSFAIKTAILCAVIVVLIIVGTIVLIDNGNIKDMHSIEMSEVTKLGDTYYFSADEMQQGNKKGFLNAIGIESQKAEDVMIVNGKLYWAEDNIMEQKKATAKDKAAAKAKAKADKEAIKAAKAANKSSK